MSHFLVAAYVALLPVQLETPMGIRFAPSDLCLLLYLLINIGVPRIERSAWSIWHAGIVAVFLLGTFLSALDRGHLTEYVVRNKLIGLAVLFGTYAMVTAEATDWSRITGALRVFVLSVSVQNTFALLVYYKVVPFHASFAQLSDQGRLTGMLVDPNAYAGLLTTALVIHMVTFFCGSPLMGRFLGLLTVASLSFGLLLTFSRSAWVGAVCAVLFLGLFRPKVMVYFLVSLAGVMAVLFAASEKGFVDYFVSMATRQKQVDARFEILDVALGLFADNPIFGIGLGQFQKYHSNIIHNTPVWFLTEFGIIGLTVFLGLSAWFLWKGVSGFMREESRMRWVPLGLVTAHICLAGLSLGIEAFYQRHWWLVAGLISSAYACVLRAQTQKAPGQRFERARFTAEAEKDSVATRA